MEQQYYQDEISLRELIEALLRQKRLIAIITIAAVLLAGVYSYIILDPTYESRMMLMASGLSYSSNSQTSYRVLTGEDPETQRVDMNPLIDAITDIPTMNLETYKEQVTSPEVLRRTIDELGLGDTYTIGGLARKIQIETVNNTQLITIKVQDTDPELAAAIVNSVGENFIEYVTESTKNRANASSEYVANQMEIEKKNYDDALLEQKDLLSQPRSSKEVDMELEAILAQLTEFKTEKNALQIRRDSLNAAIQVANSTPGNGSSLTLNQNTGRVLLDSSETTLRMELAEVESQVESIEIMIPELEKSVEELRVEYQDKYHRESLINQRVDRAKGIYESFLKKYEELRVTESAQIGEASVVVVSRAYAPANPVGPRKALNMAIGLVLGLMIGVFAAFFIEYWKQSGTDSKKASA